MHSVTLARKPLVAALQALKRIAPTRAAHKPILSHVLLRIDPDARGVTLTATDLERTLSVALQADDVARDPTARQIHTDAPNAWTFPVVDALQALKTLPDASVTLAPHELRHACGSIDVASYPREDFPHFERDPVRTARPAVTYPTPALVRALERVTPFCQKDATRYAFNAVNLQATPDAFVALATDGRRLIVHAHNADPLAPVDPQRCVVMQIPLDACKVLPALLKGSASVTLQALEHDPEPARTQAGESPDSSDPDALQDAPHAEPQVAAWVRLQFGASVLDVKTIEGRFPPYMDVVPTFTADAPPVTLQASDAAALIPAIRAGASVIPDRAHDNNGLHVAAMLPDDVRPARPGRPERPALRVHACCDGRTSAATLPVTVSGRSGHIGVNAEYLAECLDAIGPVGVTIRWNAANRPIRFDPQSGDCVVVLMPKNLNDKALDARNARYLYRAKLRHALQATPDSPALLSRAERAALAPTVRRLQALAPDDVPTPAAILQARAAATTTTPAPTPARPAGDALDALQHAPHVVHEVPTAGPFEPALCVRIAADEVASLRRVDVARVLDNAPPERLDDVACFIVANRPDLRGAVYTARGDVLAERLERDALQATTTTPASTPAPTPDPVTPAGAAGDAPHAWTRDALQDARAKFGAESAPYAFRRLAMATSTRYPNADALAPFASRIGFMTDAELRDASDWCTRELPAYLAPALVEMIRDALDARAAIEAADALQDAPTPARDPAPRQIQPTPTAPAQKRRTSGPTRETFIANYSAALRRTWAWADDAARLDRFMASVRETLTTKRTPWDWDTRIAREVFHALHGAHVAYTLRALRAMPAGDAPADALQDAPHALDASARPTLTHADSDVIDPDRVEVDPVRILAYRTIEQVTTALGIPPTYDTDDADALDALAWYLQDDDADAAIAVRSIDGSHVDRVWTVQTPADDASRQLAAMLFGDALHDSQDVQTFRDAMDAARGQAHMPEYADRPGFADAVDLARAALGKRTPDTARDPSERQIQPAPPPLYLLPAGPHTLDKTRELDAMQALLSRHPAWNTRPVSIDDALRSRAVPLALKLAYLDATRSLSPDVVARYRAELVPTVTPAPVDVKPIAPTRPTSRPARAPVATPAGVTFPPDALDAAALARYAPLVDALQHVPALVPLLECLQAHARAQSRPLGAFPELSANSPYRRSDPLASMLVELFYRLGWTAGQAKRKHLPPTGDVSTLKRELMQALQARAVAVAA